MTTDLLAPDLVSKPRTHCPTCGTVLELTLRCTAVAITTGHGAPPVTPAATPPAPAQRSAAEEKVLAAARRTGLYDPFVQVVAQVKQDQFPKDMDGFLLTFLRSLKQRLIPGYAMAAFNTLFAHRPLEYHSAQGIGVVVVDGALRLFVPNDIVVGTMLRRLNNHNSKGVKRTLKIADGEVQLQAWIRTRWGYVAEEGAFLTALRNRAFGDFARPSL